MAGAKETPRQKMIGMMYLVLTALLALNVSKEILQAFVIAYDNQEVVREGATAHADYLYREIGNRYEIDPVKMKSISEKAKQIEQKSVAIQDYIHSLKVDLIVATEGIDKSIADTISAQHLVKQSDYDTPTYFMVGNSEDGSKGHAKELKESVFEYRDVLNELISDSTFDPNLNLEGSVHNNKKMNWEMSTFYHVPEVAALQTLSQLQNDVKNAEIAALNYLLHGSTKDDYDFDTIAVKVIPNTNYVMLGGEYKADIFLAAYSKTRDPKIQLTTGDSVNVHDGLGEYSKKADREGIFTYDGTIEIQKKNSKVKSFPFSAEYIVAKPALTVSALKMNVFYKGVDNPISVSVPGVPSENISVSIDGNCRLTKKGKDKFNVVPSSNSPKKVFIKVRAKLNDSVTKDMGKIEYRVKSIPKPLAKILGTTVDKRITVSQCRSIKKVFSDKNPSFDFEAKPKVVSFEVTRLRNGQEPPAVKCTGPKLNDRALTLVKTARRGDRIKFAEITIKNPDGRKHKVSSIEFRVR